MRSVRFVGYWRLLANILFRLSLFQCLRGCHRRVWLFCLLWLWVFGLWCCLFVLGFHCRMVYYHLLKVDRVIGKKILFCVWQYCIFQSETFVVWDTIAYETELTSSKSYNIALNDIDFYFEFTVCPPTDSATSYIQIGNSSVNWNIGDLFANANCGTMVNNTFYGKAIPTETDTKVTVRRIGTNATLTVGDNTYNITGMNITCSTLKVVAITNGGVIKDFKIYSI